MKRGLGPWKESYWVGAKGHPRPPMPLDPPGADYGVTVQTVRRYDPPLRSYEDFDYEARRAARHATWKFALFMALVVGLLYAAFRPAPEPVPIDECVIYDDITPIADSCVSP